eukprot:344329_1
MIDCITNVRVITFSVLIPPSVFCLLSSTIIIYGFIKQYMTSPNDFTTRLSKWLFYAGIAFVTTSLFSLLSWTVWPILMVSVCNSKLMVIIIDIWKLSYGLQFYLLLLMLFIRLIAVFSGSPLQLSSKILRFYVAIYVIVPILIVLYMILIRYIEPIFSLSLLIFVFILVIFLIISITVLFVRRLITVYKDAESGEEWMNIVNKTTLLTLVSLSFTILAPIAVVFSALNESDIIQCVQNFILMIDMYSNLVCVVFSYSYFNKYYAKICGPLDMKCKRMWFKFVGKDMKFMVDIVNQSKTQIQSDKNQSKIEIQSNISNSSISSNNIKQTDTDIC